MIRFNWYRSGELFGVRYDYEQGDCLPTHEHDAANEHNVIVLHGTVRLEMSNGDLKCAGVGDVLDFDGSQMHTIRCLSSTATTLNLWLRGIPNGYDSLPITEHSGTM